MNFGEMVNSLRIARGKTLRQFCLENGGIDPSNWSKIERGVMSPPQDEKKLKQIAKVLGVSLKSAEWEELKDKASIGAGIIPPDILSDEKTLNCLPMFFRTIRSEKPTPEELDKLINKIKRGE